VIMGKPRLQAHPVRAALTKGEHRTPSTSRALSTGGWSASLISTSRSSHNSTPSNPASSGGPVHQRRIEPAGQQAFQQFATGPGLHLKVHRRVACDNAPRAPEGESPRCCTWCRARSPRPVAPCTAA
jgi:hypothetical protein